MDIKEENLLGDSVSNHWYYKSKLAAVLKYSSSLKVQKILDVGAGSGFFSKELLRLTEARGALCVDPNYGSESVQFINGKPVEFLTSCGQTNANLVLMMDVLEHVEDDIGLVGEYANKVPTGTWFLISVPAFSFLWSGHDIFLEHKRRYTLAEVKRVMAHAGLVLERASYFYGLIFPLAAASRLLGHLMRTPSDNPHSQLKKHNFLVNKVLAGLCSVDLLFLKINKLAGLSVFCLARKP